MFKLAKYYVIANMYKKVKFSVWVVVGSLVAMLIISLIFSDLVAMSDGAKKGLMIGLKWMMLFSLLAMMAFHLRKIFRSVSLPFANETVVVDEKKERMMQKVVLKSRTDMILDKYRKAE